MVLAVQQPASEVIDAMKEGAMLLSIIYAEKEPALVKRLLEKKITCFAMDCIPRISRAVDGCAVESIRPGGILRGVTWGDASYPHPAEENHGRRRHRPRRRCGDGSLGGAVVEGYDVRPETEEQVLSLGAKFVRTGVNASGGARGMSASSTRCCTAKIARGYTATPKPCS